MAKGERERGGDGSGRPVVLGGRGVRSAEEICQVGWLFQKRLGLRGGYVALVLSSSLLKQLWFDIGIMKEKYY